MSHAREQIRAAVQTAVTDLPTTGANVTGSRVYPHASLPSLAVYATNEELVERTAGGIQVRGLSILIEARAQATSELDNTLDDIAIEVEEAIASETPLRSLAKDQYLSNTEIELSDESSQPVGLMSMLYMFTYSVQEHDVETVV